MPNALTVPLTNGATLTFSIDPGQIVFALGANGTGKSSLLQRFSAAHKDISRRISAHRQTWLESNAINLSSQERNNTYTNLQSYDVNPQSRYKDSYQSSRPSLSIYDLVNSQDVRARKITEAVEKDDIEKARSLAANDAPIKKINNLLRMSNLPIAISIGENQELLASKSDGTPYSIALLSDGERNALLIAADVLTSKEGTLLFIDEPERHLHRSIISPLLTALFAERPDCAFVVSTHDILLPLDNPQSRTLLIRSCHYNSSGSILGWDADLLPDNTTIDDSIKMDILGARRKLLFVEGVDHSLDKPLYSLIFPEVSIIAKGSCREVEQTVAAIKDASNLHWLIAFGLVDDDTRSTEDIQKLKAKGVYSLPVRTVESIYYHPEIQRRVVVRHTKVVGGDASQKLEGAKTAALASLKDHTERLSERAVELQVRSDIMKSLPKRKDLSTTDPIKIEIDVKKILDEENAKIEALIAARDLTGIIARYPIRETPALRSIAKQLSFIDESQYEGAVRTLLIDDEEALRFVRELFGALCIDTAIAV